VLLVVSDVAYTTDGSNSLPWLILEVGDDSRTADVRWQAQLLVVADDTHRGGGEVAATTVVESDRI
jgi:hypothetical protein